MYISKGIIGMMMSDYGKGNEWFLYYVYAPPYEEEKTSFWNVVFEVIDVHAKPWIIVGDLNDVLSLDEKRDGRRFNYKLVNHLGSFMGKIGAMDLSSIWNYFYLEY